MGRLLKGGIAATMLAATTLGAVAPAEARGGGTAIVAGLLGLGIGAAIASDHPRRYRDDYYAPPPPAPVVYEAAPPRTYYAPPPREYYAPPPPPAYGYAERCRSDWQWSDYQGRYVRDRRCY